MVHPCHCYKKVISLNQLELKWYKTRVIKVKSDHRSFNPAKMRIPFQASCKAKHKTLLIVGLIKLKTSRELRTILLPASLSPAVSDGEGVQGVNCSASDFLS